MKIPAPRRSQKKQQHFESRIPPTLSRTVLISQLTNIENHNQPNVNRQLEMAQSPGLNKNPKQMKIIGRKSVSQKNTAKYKINYILHYQALAWSHFYRIPTNKSQNLLPFIFSQRKLKELLFASCRSQRQRKQRRHDIDDQ